MNQVQAEFSTAPESRLDLRQLRVPILFFAACIAAQLYLVFFKSFNWDEFLHYNFVYQLKAGTLNLPLQTLHLRSLFWAPAVSDDLVTQMWAARLAIWAVHLFTLLLIYGVARTFTNSTNALFAAFAYYTAGYVFLQGFSIRSDPFVTATLMGGLFLLARGQLTLVKAIIIGALVGVAGLMTLKSVLYAPCFAGLAWLRFSDAPDKPKYLGKLAATLVAALFTFGAIYFYLQTANSVDPKVAAQPTAKISFYLRWFTFEWLHAAYILGAAILCLPFLVGLLMAPRGWKKARLNHNEKIALVGFVAPLASLLFYKNTFPYFYVFILAPASVAIGPALGLARARYGNAFLALALSLIPLALVVLEPRDVIRTQRELIDYVHREFPEKPSYLDYSGMIVDYPRVRQLLTTGNGARLYMEQADPIVARAIDGGHVPFIIANEETVLAALEDRPIPGTFLPADLDAIRGNYVQQWGVLWREGKSIPAGSGDFPFQLRRGGEFVVDGGPVTIDGRAFANGARVSLASGAHLATGARNAPTKLWRGLRLPSAHPDIPMDEVFTFF